jgi:predicted  nucleic acid-binding Zn-ribbon protein
MASNKKVIHLGMDYSEFTGGVTEINRKMTLLDEQFKLSNEEVKAFGDETNQLSLKHELLTQKINLVSQKVEESRDKYEKAKASGEKSEKQLDNLQKEYIKNQTSLQKLNNELSDNKEKLDKASKGYTSFGDSILNMSSFLGVNVSPALQTVANKFDGMHKSVGNAILGIGAIAATFVSFTLSAADTADELLRLSSVTGITTDELQKLQYASDFLDVDVEVMTGGITKLTRNMNNARNGSKELDEAFDKLHVRYKDGNNVLLDSNEVFYRTIDALGKVKNETERDALSMTLLGKSAKELNPLIEAGSKKL